MRVVVEGPSEHAGAMLTTLMQRRGTVIGQQDNGVITVTEAEVPLAEMFGYATTLRSATQGKANFTMEFSRYLPVPEAIEEELVDRATEKAKAS
jgi:elongation factor G